jgi:asparagine synthase (glutamine-hydrolysing)
VPAFICARIARDSGIVKLLAGDGGDELFGGNSRYARQKIFEAWWVLPEPVRQAVDWAIGNRARGTAVVRKAASYVGQARIPMPSRMEAYNLLNRFGHSSVFRPEFLELVDQEAPEHLQTLVYSRHATAPFVDRMMAYDWRFTLADNDLPKVCGTARLASIQVGFPLLADELVDLALQLEPGDKVRGLRLRHFFKQALVDFLPPQIIAKKKHGFGLPVGQWLVKDRTFRDLAQASLAELAGRQLIVPGLVDDLFSRRLEEHPGYYGEMIWILMMLEQWLSARCPNWHAD